MRDDKPFGGHVPPAALFYYSTDRGGEHPERHLADYSGIMQADAYAGFDGLYVAGRKPGQIIEAACWSHGRRKFFELAELQKAPIAIEAVRASMNCSPSSARSTAPRRSSGSLFDAKGQNRSSTTSRHGCAGAPKALLQDGTGRSYGLQREAMDGAHALLDDGRICMSTDAAERAVRA